MNCRDFEPHDDSDSLNTELTLNLRNIIIMIFLQNGQCLTFVFCSFAHVLDLGNVRTCTGLETNKCECQKSVSRKILMMNGLESRCPTGVFTLCTYFSSSHVDFRSNSFLSIFLDGLALNRLSLICGNGELSL